MSPAERRAAARAIAAQASRPRLYTAGVSILHDGSAWVEAGPGRCELVTPAARLDSAEVRCLISDRYVARAVGERTDG